jgi:flavodoxin
MNLITIHNDMNTLIAYFSKTGRTKKIAEEIKKLLDADIEEIQDVKNRSGLIGWLNAGKDARSKNITKLKDVKKVPSEYELVVIGSPTWNGTVSTPIRTYLHEYKDSFHNVALFSTGDGNETDALNEMDSLIDNKSIATLHMVRTSEIDKMQYKEKLEEFIDKIKSTLN